MTFPPENDPKWYWLRMTMLLVDLLPPMPLRRHMVGTFVYDDRLDLTGCRLEHCTFDGCIIEVHKHDITILRAVMFDNCILVGDGWPDDVKRTKHWRRTLKGT